MMRAITSVPPPGGYGTMKRTGFAGHSCADDASAHRRPSSKPMVFFMASFLLNVARGQRLNFGRQRGLYRAMLGLNLGDAAPRFLGLRLAREGFRLAAVARKHRGADVGAAGFKGVGRSRHARA